MIVKYPLFFYLILFLALFLLFLSSIYKAVLLLSGKTCQISNHNGAKDKANEGSTNVSFVLLISP